MKKIKQYRKWGIYQLTEREQHEHGFSWAVIHPEIMQCYPGRKQPTDTDIQLESLEACIDWINNY